MAREAEAAVEAGPPEGLAVSMPTWRDWIMSGRVKCPGAPGQTCPKADCLLGMSCAVQADKRGLGPMGAPLPKKRRPACGAKTRAGGTCAARVVPGKKRCRLHGGLSTGAKTPEGRARIVEAQRRRWAGLPPARECPPATP